MVASSIHALNDLGSWAQCEHGSIGEWAATYSTLKFNLTHIPLQLISGVCLPAECTQQNLTDFGDSASNKVNSLLTKAQKRFDIFDFSKGYGLIQSFTRLTVSLTQSEPAVEEWEESVRIGYIFALIFCTLVIGSLCIAPNIYLLIKQSWNVEKKIDS